MSAIVCGTISSTLGGMFVSAKLTTGMPHCSARASVTCASVTSPMRIATCPMISPGLCFCSSSTSQSWSSVRYPRSTRICPRRLCAMRLGLRRRGRRLADFSSSRKQNPRLDLRFDDRWELTGISVNSTAATPKAGPTGFRRASRGLVHLFATLVLPLVSGIGPLIFVLFDLFIFSGFIVKESALGTFQLRLEFARMIRLHHDVLLFDQAVLPQVEQCVVEQLHAEVPPRLDRRVDAVCLVLSDQVGDGRGHHQHLVGGHEA